MFRCLEASGKDGFEFVGQSKTLQLLSMNAYELRLGVFSKKIKKINSTDATSKTLLIIHLSRISPRVVISIPFTCERISRHIKIKLST